MTFRRRPLRVAYVTAALRGGGAELSLLEMLRHQDASSLDRRLCVLEPGPAAPEHEDVLKAMPVHRLGVVPGHRIVAARLLPWLAALRPDVVHARLLEPNLWARFGRLVGAQVVNEERSLTVDRPEWANLANRMSRALVSVMVANSRAVAKKVLEQDGFAQERVRLIRGGVDTQRFRPATSAPTHDFVCVSRLATIKGVWDLVEAMARVHATHPSATLLLCGDGPERGALEASVEARGLTGAIGFAGDVADVPAALHRARAFVLASHEEGLPNAVMEAMASGLPVIATSVGGSAELVAPGRSGLLVPAREPVALAEAMRRYLDEPRMARDHGQVGRAAAVAELDIRRVAAEYVELYETLVRR